jgi:hypothetical protein
VVEEVGTATSSVTILPANEALEGYPMITEPGPDVMSVELHVGSRSVFAAAGLSEVSHPTLRRVVMRIDF